MGNIHFADLMLQSASKWNVLDQGNPEQDEWGSVLYHDSLSKDANGYPLEIPQNFKSQDEPQIARKFVLLDANGPYPTGNYTLLYDGEGTIQLYGGDIDKIVMQTSGKIVFTLKNNFQGLGVEIRKSLKSNPIQNIRILLPGTEVNSTSFPFNPQFLKQLEPFSCIRFLNWGGVNDSKQINWSDRNLPTYVTQSSSSKGAVAYEYMIQLCNLTQKDMWLCVPHAADANYRTQLATLIKDKLAPNLKVYVEYSNEVWNDIFEQHWYVQDNAPTNIVFHTHKYAYLANECFKSFNAVFGNNSNRMVRVLAGQHYNPWILEEAVNKMKAIGGKFDALSVASYFAPIGLSGNLSVNEIANLTKAEIATNAKKHIISLSNLAKANNVPVVMYEGGPHMTKDQFGGAGQPFVNALCQFHESQQMYDIYNDWLDFLRDSAKVKLNNILGFQDDICYFGHIKDLWDNTPTIKMKAVLDNMCSPVSNYNLDETATDILFPNPFSDIINIRQNSEEQTTILINDINGTLIFSQKIENQESVVDSSMFPPGIYFLTLIQHENRRVFKLVKIE